ncbi:MAG: ArnT family glycosyltransferase [Anaerolineales bacterium]
MRPKTRHRATIGFSFLTLCLSLSLVLIPANLALWTAGSFVLTCMLPGFLLGEILFGDDEALDVVERLVIYVGLGYGAMVLGTLLLHYIPGPLSPQTILGFYTLLTIALLMFKSGRESYAPWHLSLSNKTLTCLIILILLTSFFRFTNLGYSEFQGDEGRALLRAAEVLQGNDGVLFLHKKGPVEILVPATLYASMKRINEAAARFPFALANLTALLALFALGRRLFHTRTALLAMAIMTVDGFCIGFSRIVQYQSVVLLMTLLALFCTYRWYQTQGRRSIYLPVAAVFASIALLAHYEGFFILPGALYLVWHIAKGRRWPPGQAARRLALPILVGCTIVGIFYIPFALHPNFSETLEYLTDRRVGVGDGMPYNNITDFFFRASYYNASYYPLLMGGLLLGTTQLLLLRRHKERPIRMGVCIFLSLGAWLLIILFPSWWQFGSINLSVFVFLITGSLLLHAPLSIEERMLALWFGSAALLYFFLMVKVHTHYYVALIPWSLIAAKALSTGWDWLHRRCKILARTAVVLGIILLLLCTYYVYIVFVRHSMEYHQNYPAAKPPIYWTPFHERPQGGYFGFPYRTAWKTVGGMYDAGILQGTYDSNQKERVTNWYTRGAMRCPQSDYFIVARDVEDPHEIIPGVIDGEYMPAMEILRDGEPQLWIFERGYDGSLQRYDHETYAADFDRRLSAPIFRVGAPLDEVFEPPHHVEASFGGHFQLVGWDMSPTIAAQGDRTILTLYWRTLKPTAVNYHVFVHVGEGDTVAQEDSVPRCGQHPTYRWEQGEEVVDRYLLQVSPETPLGTYPVRVGMYDFMTKDRLTIRDMEGREMDSLLLTHMRIGEPQTERPDITDEYEANLGKSVRLLGYDLPDTQIQPGGNLSLTLYWECLDNMKTDYTVFVHLLGPDGEIYGQRDTFPLNGRLPTTLWVPQEILSDPYTIDVADDTPVGNYSIAIGMYDLHSGERLPVSRSDGTQLPDDQILLSEVLRYE